MLIDTPMTDVYICDAIRTPIGRYGGALSSVRTDDLGAVHIKALMARNPQVDWGAMSDVLFGCANQAGEDNRNVLDCLRSGMVLRDCAWLTGSHTLPFSPTHPYGHRTTEATQRTNRQRREAG